MTDALRSLARWYSVPLVLLAWEAIARSGEVHSGLMPDLPTIAAALAREIAAGDIPFHSGVTLGRAAIGFGSAVVAGVIIGVVMARSRLIERFVEPLFSFGYPVPKLAFYPIFIFVIGVGTLSKLMLVFLECVYPVALSTYLGVKGIERIQIWAALAMGANARQVFWRVIVPAAAPYVFAALRIAAHVALIVVVILEMIGDSIGLGYYVAAKSASFDFADSFAGTAAVIFWGFLIDRAIIYARARVVFWEAATPAIG